MENEDAKQERVAVADRQTLLSAWTTTRMEKDKQLLTLSALAIGLLVTLRSEIDDVCAYYVWLSSGASFLFSIIIILRVLHLNSVYIEQILAGDDQVKTKGIDKCLRCSAILADCLFATGVGLTAFLVVYGTEFSILKGVWNVG